MTWLAETAMLSHGWRRFAMLLLAGAIAGLSVPPLFVLPALLVAVPIWIWALDGAERRPGVGRILGPTFTIGFAFGLGYFCVAIHWVGAALVLEGGGYTILAPLAVLALAAVLALFWGFGSAVAHLMWSDGASRIFGFAGALALAEFARGTVFSGFPFDLLGYALTANDEMNQLASVIGVYGLTFVAALAAATPALIWPADGRTLTTRLVPFFVGLAAIAAQVGYGNVRLATTTVETRADMRVRLVQPVIAEHTDWETAEPARVLDRLIELSETRMTPSDPGLIGTTHLIWPESVFPFYLSEYPEALARIARMLPAGTTLITGAPRESWNAAEGAAEGAPGFNSILAIDTAGEIVASYDKQQLVPIGEYLPFPEFWRLFGIQQFVPGTYGWAAGTGRRVMSAPGTPPFIALICYEAIFPDTMAADPSAAEFIVNLTNDAWFAGSIGPAQHAHHARLRAVETGLPLLRGANSGVTMVTDPLGRITARLAENERALLDVTPTHRIEGTIFARAGHWPFFVACVAAILAGFLGRVRRRRTTA